MWSSLQWVVGEEGKQGNEVNLKELGSLRNLIALRTLLPTADFPGSNSLFKNLLSFQINISLRNDWKWLQGDEFQNELHLNLDNKRIPVVDSGINELLTKTDALFLRLKVVKKVLDDPTLLNHIQLRGLEICSWEGAEYLFDTVDLDPHLKLLESRDVHNLKRTCHGKLPVGSFKELRHINVNSCNRLENLFSTSIAEGLVQLQSLSIERCEMMEEIIATKRREHRELTNKIRFPKLSTLRLVNLPSLVSFCKSMEEIEFPQLSDLYLEDLPKIGSLFPNSLAWQGKHDTATQCLSNKKVTFPSTELFELLHNNMEWKVHGHLPVGSLHELRKLHVQGFNKLLNVVPSDLLQGLSNLEELTVQDCASLVEVFKVEGLNVEESDIVPLSKLKELYLDYLPELTHILKREPEGILFFQSLTVLSVCNCNNLRNLFSASMAKSAKQLEVLVIEKCEMMEQIVIKGENEEEYTMDKITMRRVKKLSLYDLPNLTSFYQDLNINFDRPSCSVSIRGCPKMRFPKKLSVVNQAIWQQEHFDVPMPGVAGGMLSVPYDMSGMPLRDAAVGQPVSIPDLATALASATPVQQRTMLGESLYPLVDLLEHEMAAKVTGMLLEMDMIEVLRLLESPEALKVKVGEAMNVPRNVDSVEEANSATDQLSLLSLNEEINQETGQQEHLDDAGYGNDNEIDLNT
ncbi:hypothetical protein L1049_009219 [Liquidambar formosana]|uniref:PABC domain-containing protein n=1 Tax=Liquidambar formosana TaxID=63359 RepID=A0AAP0SAW8_LIQFO